LVAVYAGPADLGRIYDRLGLFVGMVDNFIKPWLIGFGIQMPMLLTILGVFGGLIAFGFLGLFIGPTRTAIMLIRLQTCRLSGRSFDFTDIEIRRFVSLLKHADDGPQCPEGVNRVGLTMSETCPLRLRQRPIGTSRPNGQDMPQLEILCRLPRWWRLPMAGPP
jgi:hypothetical protein